MKVGKRVGLKPSQYPPKYYPYGTIFSFPPKSEPPEDWPHGLDFFKEPISEFEKTHEVILKDFRRQMNIDLQIMANRPKIRRHLSPDLPIKISPYSTPQIPLKELELSRVDERQQVEVSRIDEEQQTEMTYIKDVPEFEKVDYSSVPLNKNLDNWESAKTARKSSPILEHHRRTPMYIENSATPNWQPRPTANFQQKQRNSHKFLARHSQSQKHLNFDDYLQSLQKEAKTLNHEYQKTVEQIQRIKHKKMPSNDDRTWKLSLKPTHRLNHYGKMVLGNNQWSQYTLNNV